MFWRRGEAEEIIQGEEERRTVSAESEVFALTRGAGRSPPVAVLPNPTFTSGPPACLCPGHSHLQAILATGPRGPDYPQQTLETDACCPVGGLRGARVGTKLHGNRLK